MGVPSCIFFLPRSPTISLDRIRKPNPSSKLFCVRGCPHVVGRDRQRLCLRRLPPPGNRKLDLSPFPASAHSPRMVIPRPGPDRPHAFLQGNGGFQQEKKMNHQNDGIPRPADKWRPAWRLPVQGVKGVPHAVIDCIRMPLPSRGRGHLVPHFRPRRDV